MLKVRHFVVIKLFILICVSCLAYANTKSDSTDVKIIVKNNDGDVLENMVITVHGNNLSSIPPEERPTVKQINKQFEPHIKVIPVDAEVTFPNLDSVQHHVYSFSKAKTFELALYDSDSKSNVVFDTAGVVEMGCNVHDWMLGYVYVTDAPIYGKTNSNGVVNIALPVGEYSIKVWHPRLKSSDIDKIHTLKSSGNKQTFTLRLEEEMLPDELTDEDDLEFDGY